MKLAKLKFPILLIIIFQCKSIAQPVDSILWNSNLPIPKTNEIPLLGNIDHYSIKKWQPEIDGYHFLHGVALAFHKDKLYASFAHNKGAENTVSEEASYCISGDKGKSWSDVMAIDSGIEEDLAISHGVFLSSNNELWAFHGCFYGKMQNVHMRAYLFNDKNNEWEKKGVVAESGFWPLDEPKLMDDGNWIIGGISVGETCNIHGPNHSAVAISHGDNLFKWDVVKINKAQEVGNIWGESSNIVKGNHVINIARYGHKRKALIAQSNDYGQSWTDQFESNLSMATSKPFCGVLCSGHCYLINSIASNIKGRYPLTIAIGRPGEKHFSQLFSIRNDVVNNSLVESTPGAALSYPYAIEHEGKLYVGYSNDGTRGKNLNSAELAVIQVSDLIQSKNIEISSNGKSDLSSIPDTLYYADNYGGHLQGMATDYKSYIFWSHTTQIVKTDFQGNIKKIIDVPFHHGDLDCYNGKIYVAVNLGLFNTEDGSADSWIYIYDEENLDFIEKFPLPEVVFGAGGIAIHENRLMVVGGLPLADKFRENFVYEYTMDFELVKIHKLETGYTHLGIQTASFYNGHWYFGCYGNKSKSLHPVVLKAKMDNDSLKLIKTYPMDFSFGLIGLYDNKWLISNPNLDHFGCTINLID